MVDEILGRGARQPAYRLPKQPAAAALQAVQAPLAVLVRRAGTREEEAEEGESGLRRKRNKPVE